MRYHHLWWVVGVVVFATTTTAAAQQPAAERQLPPAIAEVLSEHPELRLYEVTTGTTGWDIALGLYGQGARWPDPFGLNVAAGLTQPDAIEVVPGPRPHHWPLYPGDLLILPVNAEVSLSGIVRPYAAAPTPALAPTTAEAAGFPWGWLIGLLIISAAVIAYLLWDNARLRRMVAALQRTINGLTETIGEMNERLEAQRQLDFQARRTVMPPLPEEVADAVLAGPPVRFEGITPENRDEVFGDAAVAAYTSLHGWAAATGVTVETRNERRVLLSSRPGETVEVSFGDEVSRPVTLVREPGWMVDATIQREGRVVQELKDVCVLGFCANRLAYTLRWLENCLVEPYDAALIHSEPDWTAMEAAAEAEAPTAEEVADVVIHGEDGGLVVVSSDSATFGATRVTTRGRVAIVGDEVRIE